MSYRKRVFFADAPANVVPFDRDPAGAITGVGGESWVNGRKNATGYAISTGDDDTDGGLRTIGSDIAAANRGSLGMHIVTADPANEGGRTLVTTLPAGDYYLVTQPGGRVELWRFTGYDQPGTYPGTDLGNVSDGLPGGITAAGRGNLSAGARVGLAAAAAARTTGDALRRINERNRAFWAPGGAAGVK
ncbi:MAG: hypothetical protein ABSC95_32790 [Acetobacteraceae bacterium]|jgi:hypothetical protein